MNRCYKSPAECELSNHRSGTCEFKRNGCCSLLLEQKINHERTLDIVCPWCGYEFLNSWKTEPDKKELGLQQCDHCGKEFYAERHILIEYSTFKFPAN